jgi:uncharacterized protein (TIGR02301 family)
VIARAASLAMALCLSASLAASAADSAPPPKTAAPAPAAAPEPPPYEPQLLRLSELMGALSYLRDLCGLGDGAKFRAEMTALLESDPEISARRDVLAGAFNRGFRDYELTYRTCTPIADAIVTRFLDESSRLAAEVANRYSR